MKTVTRIAFLIFIFSIIALSADAQKKRKKKERKQDTKEQVEVRLKNGNVLVGELIKYSQDSLVIKNEQFGRMAFAQNEIKKYIGLDGKSNDPDEGGHDKSKYQSQYFFSPSARPVGKGNKYFTNFNIFINSFSFGLTDNFSLNAGFESVSILAGQIPIMYINPKFSIPVGESTYIGIGSTLFIAPLDGNGGTAGVTYGNITLGSAEKNFTFGLAYAYVFGDSDREPLFQLGYTFPISKKVSILGEGFFTTEFEGAYNIGLRIITRSNIAFDAGITRATGFGSSLLGIPLLSLSIPF